MRLLPILSDVELVEKIKVFLIKNPRSNARRIAKEVEADKSKVNSVLYANKGALFAQHDTSPPTWSIFQGATQAITLPITKYKVLRTTEPLHVDFQGGDWKIVIQIRDTSRNDPVVSLERTGPNNALIKVSSSVISNDVESDIKFPDVVLALASSALAWEIAVHRDAAIEDRFNFETAIKDIYMSLSLNKNNQE